MSPPSLCAIAILTQACTEERSSKIYETNNNNLHWSTAQAPLKAPEATPKRDIFRHDRDPRVRVCRVYCRRSIRGTFIFRAVTGVGLLSRIRRTWCRCRKGVPRFGSVLCNVRLWAPIWIWHNSTCLRLGQPAKIHFISHSATQIKCCRARDSREFQGFRAEKCPSGWVLPRVPVVIARRGPDNSSNVCLSNCRDSVTVEGVLEFS